MVTAILNIAVLAVWSLVKTMFSAQPGTIRLGLAADQQSPGSSKWFNNCSSLAYGPVGIDEQCF